MANCLPEGDEGGSQAALRRWTRRTFNCGMSDERWRFVPADHVAHSLLWNHPGKAVAQMEGAIQMKAASPAPTEMHTLLGYSERPVQEKRRG